MTSEKNKSSIAIKMIPLILLVTLLVALFTFTIIIKQDYQEGIKEVENSLYDIQRSLLRPLALSLFYEDQEQVLEALKGIFKIPSVVELRVKLIGENKVKREEEFYKLN